MRNIQVSPDVFAAIWTRRLSGENDEDTILRRVLRVEAHALESTVSLAKIGYSDPANGFEIPEGFEIFRVYKSARYRATATGGRLVLGNTGTTYDTLNRLSVGVTGRSENTWKSWYYVREDGKRELINTLRKVAPATRKRMMTLADLDL